MFDVIASRGQTVVIVTHDSKLAQRAPRTINMLDGQIATDAVRASGV